MSRQHLAIRETNRGLRLTTLAVLAGLSVAGCSNVNDLDWDLRPSERFSTTDAARNTTGSRPAPDARGVISYPGYQVVVAQRGERVADIAARLGLDATALANHNAIAPDTTLRGGELLVLPSRVGDGSASTPITATPLGPATPGVAEPLRHTVERGETAFTIARLYNVSPRSIAEWNGLPADMSVREGQILVIPVPQSITAAAAGDPLNATGLAAPTVPVPAALPAAETTTATTQPGQGSPTPVPPSASTPRNGPIPARKWSPRSRRWSMPRSWPMPPRRRACCPSPKRRSSAR